MGFLDVPKGKKRRDITFEGGPGDTIERAVIMQGAPNEALGVEAQYRYLGQWFGRRGTDWQLVSQGLLQLGRRKYVEMRIKLTDDTQRIIYFDIRRYRTT